MELRQQVLAENAPKYESKSDKRIKYLLDENVNPRLGVGLRSQWPEMTAWCIGDPGAPPRGTLDPDILIWCELHDFILITNNRASMPVHLQEHLVAGHHSPGVITLTDKMSMGAVIESLGDLYKLSDSDNYSDNISYMPL
ncbi:MAG: hypothetical protein GY759_01305 [Chloroflexi bacterium]|nr:hypothetical protein [Chloroflexota bacterium]